MKYSASNKPLVCMQTQSTCYKGTKKMTVKGVLWHSTAANNPTLKRYIQPSDKKPAEDTYSKAKWLTVLGKNTYNNDMNHIERKMGMNAWIGKLANGTVTSVQSMPWDYRPWGCASGKNGSCNSGWIQFEICEDDLKDKTYFDKIYKEACELTAYLCKMYNLDPKGTQKIGNVKVPVILCHQDSYKLGLGNNHADIYHWFKKYGKDMEDVRNDVAKLMNSTIVTPPKKEEVIKPEPSKNTITNTTFKVGDIVSLKSGAKWSTGSSIPNWVFSKQLYVREIHDNNLIAISTLKTGAITGVVKSNYLTLKANTTQQTSTTQPFKSYLVIITANSLNVRNGAGMENKINTTVKKGQVYTIIDEKDGWGKLKSGAGWINLIYTKKL